MRSWLKELRKDKNLTQAEAADIMGISRQYYAFIESGDRMPDLTLSIMTQISNIFGLTLNDIKKFEEAAYKPEGRHHDRHQKNNKR